ncbi:hypothetical protein BIY22_00125 [Vibrio panuliri]|uniref:Uncharacterized protein n=1 Tax=Vibrio panuliri TaxID=1381081 RepID=A0A1Q9HQ17_9VIBR|nr:hypothetical protein [Vibrio panuliri]OLQ92943.1 hypothetical protein BIY22_00125 [Vibrio panuliri]
MYRLVCGIGALALGLLLFGCYDWVFSSQWYVSLSGKLIVTVLEAIPDLRSYLANSEFINLVRLVSIVQALVLSLIFALVFSAILGAFKGLIGVVQYAIFGAFAAFMYFVLPALVTYIDNNFFASSLALPLKGSTGLLDVLIWYLPLMLSVFYIAGARRRQHARTERYWFR